MRIIIIVLCSIFSLWNWELHLIFYNFYSILFKKNFHILYFNFIYYRGLLHRERSKLKSYKKKLILKEIISFRKNQQDWREKMTYFYLKNFTAAGIWATFNLSLSLSCFLYVLASCLSQWKALFISSAIIHSFDRIKWHLIACTFCELVGVDS